MDALDLETMPVERSLRRGKIVVKIRKCLDIRVTECSERRRLFLKRWEFARGIEHERMKVV
ncbi:hypothetical protein [Sinorhizobium sp. BG8]|uniref:hypothetical protein n=1 Tax=Sinorhizobium sp. BG8 TaxID=2613773 RepID=UPI00193DCCF3|nr:hypothetical protein [Sinorhizobium sp. BG8]QRM57879.1 hypothetical protein F3Y30_25885 [Sinorhizobium sp. BG8]